MDDVNKEELDTSLESSATEQGTGEGNQEMVPKSVMLQRLKEVKEGTEKKIKEQLKTSGQEGQPPAQEGREQEKAKLRELIKEIDTDKEVEEKKALEELDKKISELKVIDPTLDEKALLDIIEKYELDSADKAFKIYNDLKAGQAPTIKPKLPTATKTSDEVKEQPFEPKTKGSLWDAAQKGLEKFGLK